MADNEVRRGDAPISRRYRPVWPLVFFVLLVAVSLLLHLEKSQRQKKVLAVKERFAAMVSALPIEEAKAERARFYGIQYYLGYPLAVSHAVSDFVLRLSAITPPGQLRELQVDPGVRDFSFTLTVGIAAGGVDAARQRFAAFFEELGNIPGVTQASYSPKARNGPGAGSYDFAVNGRAEWQ